MRGLLLLAVIALASASAGKEQLNPITRVVELMQGLVKKVEKDGKAEESLFDDYVCWYKTVVSTKKASNEAAKDRIEALTAYIDDINSGRVEFTSERKDLEGDIEKLNTEIEAADAMRNKEHEDFIAARDEMNKAIAALEEAVDVLGSATSAHTEGTLMSTRFDLRRVVKIGKQMLSESDVKFLEQALNSENPEVDWKKLTTEGGATFKKTYKARSFKIQEIMADMLQTFQDNLADAQGKENTAVSNHGTLKASKESQLSAAQDALSSGDGESGARTLNAAESQDEVDALTTQVSNDQKFISQVEASYADKVTEWKERKRLRTEEIASISKAMEVLNGDDARDTFHSSQKSQEGLLLLQESGCMRTRASMAIDILRAKATEHNSVRLAALAVQVRMSTTGHFDAIIRSVDKMISDLNEEYAEDLKNKEQCESDRAENTKIAKQNAQIMDDQTALIARKQAEIDEKTAEVKSIKEHVAELRLQMEEALAQRNKENREFQAATADDQAAKALIIKSQEVLAKFYDDNNLVFVQVKVQQPPEMTAAGEAPPPPPSTFTEPYGGAKGESNGIQAILTMIHDDITKDIATATSEEAKALSNFNTFNQETLTLISSLESEKTSLEGEIGDAEIAQVNAKQTRDEKKAILDNTMDFLRSIAAGCDFIAVNFQVRKANRESEIDGLYEAKASLSGGSFSLSQTGQHVPSC